jgi:hypothetical protein
VVRYPFFPSFVRMVVHKTGEHVGRAPTITCVHILLPRQQIFLPTAALCPIHLYAEPGWEEGLVSGQVSIFSFFCTYGSSQDR